MNGAVTAPTPGRPTRIAVVQLRVDLRDELPDRAERVAGLVRARVGADLVVLPELWAHGAFADDTWEQQAESLDGPTVKALRAASADAGATVHMGSILERAPDGRLFNTAVLIGPDGEIQATYRKIHRFGFAAGEARLLSAGEDLVVHAGMGLATCYDLRFPELFRALLDRGARMYVVASSWPEPRIGHWRLLTRARAVENQCVVVACNAVGSHNGVTLGGHSVVVDPWGEVLAEGGAGEEVLDVDLDLDAVDRTRERFPVFADRRLR